MSGDEFATYYLVQRSRTGYSFVTYYATRFLEDARRRFFDEPEDAQHHRILDVGSGRVYGIRRPGVV